MSSTIQECARGWQVYMVRCIDDSFYTGVAKHLMARITEHNSSSKGAKYTRARRPVTLVYCEPQPDRRRACQREYAIKQLTRREKLALIASHLNTLSDESKHVYESNW